MVVADYRVQLYAAGTKGLPYFDQNIYLNMKKSFWWWSDRDRTESSFPEALRSHPQIILV